MERRASCVRISLHAAVLMIIMSMILLISGMDVNADSNNWSGPDYTSEFHALSGGQMYDGMYYGSDKCVIYSVTFAGGDTTLNIPSTLSTPNGTKTVWGIVSYSQYLGREAFSSDTYEYSEYTGIREDNYSSWEEIIPCINSASTQTVKKIVLPSSVEFVGDCAFAGYTGLTEFAASSKLTIGRRAFMDCTSLQTATYPDGTDLSFTAFFNCSALKKITCAPGDIMLHDREPENIHLEEISFAPGCEGIDSEFYNIKTLKKVTLPSGVKYIVEGAFSGCTALSSINLPSSLTDIGDDAFCNCKSLKIAVVHKGSSLGTQYQGSGITSITWNGPVQYYDLSAFNGCRNLASIRINSGRFYSENGVQYFRRNDGGTELVRYPPAKNTGGTFTIPNKVTVIDVHAFESCSLSTIKTPYVVTLDEEDGEVYNEASDTWKDVTFTPFDNMRRIATIYFVPEYRDDNGKIDTAYGYCGYAVVSGKRYKHKWTRYNTSPAKGKTFVYDGIRFKVTKKADTTIGKAVAIGPAKKTATSIAFSSRAYAGDAWAHDVTAIEKKAFSGMKKLKTVNMRWPSKLTSIGNNAFAKCPRLTSVVIGPGVRQIGKNAFLKDKKLKTIEIQSTRLKKAGKNCFKGISKKARIQVPASKLKAYKKLLKKKGQSKKVKIVKL